MRSNVPFLSFGSKVRKSQLKNLFKFCYVSGIHRINYTKIAVASFKLKEFYVLMLPFYFYDDKLLFIISSKLI